MKKAILALIATTLLGSAIIPVTSTARGVSGFGNGRPDPEFRQQRRLDRLTNLLELTDEQQASIETLNETFGEQTSGIRETMHQSRETLKALSSAETVDTDTIKQVADELGALFADLVVIRTEKRIAMRAILTQEQLDKLEELHEAIADRRGNDSDDEPEEEEES